MKLCGIFYMITLNCWKQFKMFICCHFPNPSCISHLKILQTIRTLNKLIYTAYKLHTLVYFHIQPWNCHRTLQSCIMEVMRHLHNWVQETATENWTTILPTRLEVIMQQLPQINVPLTTWIYMQYLKQFKVLNKYFPTIQQDEWLPDNQATVLDLWSNATQL